MSSSYSAYIASVVQQLVTYMGMSNVILGVLGNSLNLIVFLSLQTFRQNSCAFYLTIMSFVNIGQLITGQFSRVMITGFGIDWTQSSLFYCKFRPFGFQVFTFISLTCICLATIDQFLATCTRPRWQQWSNIKLAQRLTVISIIFWLIYGIPYLVFYDQTVSASTGIISCANSNMLFRQYNAYMNMIILSGGLPILITVIFGGLAYKNVRQIAYRTIPLVRRELDKQLTNMVLIQVVFSFFALFPYDIGNVIGLIPSVNNDPIIYAQFTLAINICACIFYLYFACPFYIYVCVSERFRQQLIYVLFKLRFNRWQNRMIAINQILPHPS